MDKQDKIIRYRQLNQTAQEGQIVFAGSSLMEMFPIEQFVAEDNLPVVVYNRGIGGFVTDELLTNLAVCVLDLAPRMLFLNIGTNDLSDASRPMAQIMGTYRAILEKVLQALPNVQIYLMAYYPINEEAATPEMKPCLRVRTNAARRNKSCGAQLFWAAAAGSAWARSATKYCCQSPEKA